MAIQTIIDLIISILNEMLFISDKNLLFESLLLFIAYKLNSFKLVNYYLMILLFIQQAKISLEELQIMFILDFKLFSYHLK